jgi:hypothetical protein
MRALVNAVKLGETVIKPWWLARLPAASLANRATARSLSKCTISVTIK